MDHEEVHNHWTAIVVTCSSPAIREGLETECSRLSNAGMLPRHELLLVIDDPQWEKNFGGSAKGSKLDPGVGSGGATINALLTTVERLSARKKYTTINSELVYSSRILVVHHGRVLAHTPGGSPFLYVPPEQTFVPQSARYTSPTLLQHVIWMATKIGAQSSMGVWVTSLDTFIPDTPTICTPITDGINGAVVCTIKVPLLHAQHHGIVITNDSSNIQRMEYKMTYNKIKDVFMKDEATVISGLVFLSASLTEQLLGLHMLPPLDRCTYYGTDSGIPPLQVSLYFDLLLPLCCSVEEEEYLSGQCGAVYAQMAKYNSTAAQELRTARLQIWKQLQGLKAMAHSLEGTSHQYFGSHLTYESSVLPLLACSTGNSKLYPNSCGSKIKLINSCVEGNVNCTIKDIFIVDSCIGKDVTLEVSGMSIISGFQLPEAKLKLKMFGDCIWQMHPTSKHGIITCHGIKDKLTIHYEEDGASIFNTDWSVFLERTGLCPEILWPEQSNPNHTLINAKIFSKAQSEEEQIQLLTLLVGALHNDSCMKEWRSRIEEWKNESRVSLLDSIDCSTVPKIIQHHEDIYLKMVEKMIEATADEVGGNSMLPVFEYVAARGQSSIEEILAVFHQQLGHERPSTPRLLANIADLLGCFAAGDGGLRSGPAANPKWREAILLLKANSSNLSRAMEIMHVTCKLWLQSSRPDDMIRAARHYERASQIVISHLVETAEVHVSPMWVDRQLRQQVPLGVWVEANSPARIDLAGGWTDTPPICYEQGGAVLNVAIKINKKKPIGARVRFIPEPHIVCVLRDWSGGDVRLTWSELDHLMDYDNPVAPGALVKVVLLYCHLVEIQKEDSLKSQLEKGYGAGVEVEVWSNLPQGSGLGGSSLLAGTLVSAMAVLLGHPLPSHAHLVHATLTIEQRLTTGGGWQDQVGGLVGGAKLGISGIGTPVTVNTYKIPLQPEMLDFFNNHLLLLYTGKVRLARNLLQTVIRNWYARDSNIIECFSKLQDLALDASQAVLNGNREKLGHCIDRYWSLKKMVASGCEPGKVTRLMSLLRTYSLGMSLAGAGGGGYLYALKKSPDPLPPDVLPENLTIDNVEIDQEGLELRVGGQLLTQSSTEEILTLEKLSMLKMCGKKHSD